MVFGIKANVIKYKDQNVCILMNEVGFGSSFNQEFSKITSEGYELKVVHTFASFKVLGVGGDTAYLYYFQKFDGSNNPLKNEFIQQKRDPSQRSLFPKSNTTGGNVKFCKSCGNSNELDATLCRKCGRVFRF